MAFLRLLVIIIILLHSHCIIAQDPYFGMVLVKGGSFMMGSNSDKIEEKPLHEVHISDFYITKHEITQALWNFIMDDDTTSRYFKNCPTCPVERVSWYNVLEFIKRLNIKTGIDYRLPTEAEWEYAAKGGCLSRGYRYSGSNVSDSVAWRDGNSGRRPHPVGGKKPNELGIYDMTGNVFEWCNDYYSPGFYKHSGKLNPTGPDNGSYRVIRGGSWFHDDTGLGVTDRHSANPEFRYGYVGFRLVRK